MGGRVSIFLLLLVSSLSDTDMDAYQETPYCPPSGLQPLPEWIPLTPLDQMAQTEYDVLIVGTGAGGGAVLWRLCEKWKNSGLKIGVVEAGGLVLPSHVYNIPTLGSTRNRAV